MSSEDDIPVPLTKARGRKGLSSEATLVLGKAILGLGDAPDIDPEAAMDMLVRLAEGESYEDIMADEETRPWSMAYDLILRKRYPEYRYALTTAQVARAQRLLSEAEEMIREADSPFNLRKAEVFWRMANSLVVQETKNLEARTKTAAEEESTGPEEKDRVVFIPKKRALSGA